jgi:hypothetical protein
VRTQSFDLVPTTNLYAIVKEHCRDETFCVSTLNLGGGERVRTDDPLRARQVLSQLSYTPNRVGGPGWARTTDLTIISRVL